MLITGKITDKAIKRYVTMDIGGDSFEVWKKQPERVDGDFVDKWTGEYKDNPKSVETQTQQWKPKEFKHFYPGIPYPKPGRCLVILFE